MKDFIKENYPELIFLLFVALLATLLICAGCSNQADTESISTQLDYEISEVWVIKGDEAELIFCRAYTLDSVQIDIKYTEYMVTITRTSDNVVWQYTTSKNNILVISTANKGE